MKTKIYKKIKINKKMIKSKNCKQKFLNYKKNMNQKSINLKKQFLIQKKISNLQKNLKLPQNKKKIPMKVNINKLL